MSFGQFPLLVEGLSKFQPEIRKPGNDAKRRELNLLDLLMCPILGCIIP